MRSKPVQEMCEWVTWLAQYDLNSVDWAIKHHIKSNMVQILGWLQQFFGCQNFSGLYSTIIRTTEKFVIITLKFELCGSTIRVMSPNDADGMANSVDPDQTAPLGAVWSRSALFAQAYLSENLGSLR